MTPRGAKSSGKALWTSRHAKDRLEGRHPGGDKYCSDESSHGKIRCSDGTAGLISTRHKDCFPPRSWNGVVVLEYKEMTFVHTSQNNILINPRKKLIRMKYLNSYLQE